MCEALFVFVKALGLFSFFRTFSDGHFQSVYQIVFFLKPVNPKEKQTSLLKFHFPIESMSISTIPQGHVRLHCS